MCPKESDSLEVISMPCKLFAGNINADAAVIQLEFEINIAESFFFLTEHFAIRKFKSIQILLFYVHIYIAICLGEVFKPKCLDKLKTQYFEGFYLFQNYFSPRNVLL